MANLSIHAQAAAAIRKNLKAQGIAGRVNSESYSMGSSVNVYVQDLNPAQYAAVKEFADQYQYGDFDGMQDLYNYSNVKSDLPQVKYVFVNNRISDEMRQKIWDFALGFYAGIEGAPADAQQASNFRIADWNMYGDQLINRLFQGGFNNDQFWKAQ